MMWIKFIKKEDNVIRYVNVQRCLEIMFTFDKVYFNGNGDFSIFTYDDWYIDTSFTSDKIPKDIIDKLLDVFKSF
ncbi:MAG: hypothetical protein IJ094_12990 [Bacilli bacterium]|nr:hypothetical protein [Bacilli bacterium]